MTSWRPEWASPLPTCQGGAVPGISVDVQMDVIHSLSIQLPSTPACCFVLSLRGCDRLPGRVWNPRASCYDAGFLFSGMSFWFHRELHRRGLQWEVRNWVMAVLFLALVRGWSGAVNFPSWISSLMLLNITTIIIISIIINNWKQLLYSLNNLCLPN